MNIEMFNSKKNLKKLFFFCKALIYYIFPNHISEIIVINVSNLNNYNSVKIITMMTDKTLKNNSLVPLSDTKNQEYMLTNKYKNLDFKVNDYVISNNLIQSTFGLSTINRSLFIEPFWKDYKMNIQYKKNFFLRRLYKEKILDRDYIRYFTRRKHNIYDNVLVLSTASSSLNYYHFLLDMVPKFADNFKRFNEYEKILFSGPPSIFLYEFIDMFGIKEKSIIMSNKFSVLAKKSLVVGARSQVGNPTVRVVQSIQSIFMSRLSKSNNLPSKIYISRSNAKRRKIINEEELYNSLSKIGFIKVKLEELNLLEQINLFYNAEFVIGPHGAGMANLVFCTPNTNIIELFPESYTEPCMYNISKVNSLDYHFLVFKNSDKHDNFLVETSRVIKYIIKNFSV